MGLYLVSSFCTKIGPNDSFLVDQKSRDLIYDNMIYLALICIIALTRDNDGKLSSSIVSPRQSYG